MLIWRAAIIIFINTTYILHTLLKESIHFPNLEEVLHMHNPFHSCFRLNSILIMQLTVAQAITSMFSLDEVQRWVIIFECN